MATQKHESEPKAGRTTASDQVWKLKQDAVLFGVYRDRGERVTAPPEASPPAFVEVMHEQTPNNNAGNRS